MAWEDMTSFIKDVHTYFTYIGITIFQWKINPTSTFFSFTGIFPSMFIDLLWWKIIYHPT